MGGFPRGDALFQLDLNGRDGANRLFPLYAADSDLIVPIFSKDYLTNGWCVEEWEIIVKRMKAEPDANIVHPVMMWGESPKEWTREDFAVQYHNQSPQLVADCILSIYRKQLGEKARLRDEAELLDDIEVHCSAYRLCCIINLPLVTQM